MRQTETERRANAAAKAAWRLYARAEQNETEFVGDAARKAAVHAEFARLATRDGNTASARRHADAACAIAAAAQAHHEAQTAR